MKDYVQIWFEFLRRRRQELIPSRIEIVGEMTSTQARHGLVPRSR